MSRPRFSKNYRTYGEWLKVQPKGSKYAKEIIRKHQYFPDKSLSQLRELKAVDYDLSTADLSKLSEKERKEHRLSLVVLREMRNGENFTHMLKKVGIKKGIALKHLGKNLYKSGGTWEVTSTDSIHSRMRMYSTEGSIVIVTANRKDRILLAQHRSWVGKALKKNDPSILDKFKDLKITDTSGKEHRFETDLQALYEIKEAQEEPEFQELYVD